MNINRTSIVDIEDMAAVAVKATKEQLDLLEEIGQTDIPVCYSTAKNGMETEGTIVPVTHQWVVAAARASEAPRLMVIILPQEMAGLLK